MAWLGWLCRRRCIALIRLLFLLAFVFIVGLLLIVVRLTFIVRFILIIVGGFAFVVRLALIVFLLMRSDRGKIGTIFCRSYPDSIAVRFMGGSGVLADDNKDIGIRLRAGAVADTDLLRCSNAGSSRRYRHRRRGWRGRGHRTVFARRRR